MWNKGVCKVYSSGNFTPNPERKLYYAFLLNRLDKDTGNLNLKESYL